MTRTSGASYTRHKTKVIRPRNFDICGTHFEHLGALNSEVLLIHACEVHPGAC
jgi:hypothetical protein